MFPFYKVLNIVTFILNNFCCPFLDDAGNRLRFQLELEFVQCLANPNYLNCKLFEQLIEYLAVTDF